MFFKPPLTVETLKAIGERNRASADVKALLWEIKRLRAQRLREYQLRGTRGAPGGSMKHVLVQHTTDLLSEPCVVEQERKFYGVAEANRRLALELRTSTGEEDNKP